MIQRKKEAAADAAKNVSGSSKKVISRLYHRSKSMQEEGKAKRKMVEQKLSPRAQTPSRKISLERATDVYHRGMAYKAEKEKRLFDAKGTNQSLNLLRSRSRLRDSTPSRFRDSTPNSRQMYLH